MQVQPVPAKAALGIVSLRTPGPVGLNGFPAILARRVIDVRLRPMRIVTRVKLPTAVEGDDTLSHAVEVDYS